MGPTSPLAQLLEYAVAQLANSSDVQQAWQAAGGCMALLSQAGKLPPLVLLALGAWTRLFAGCGELSVLGETCPVGV